MHIIQKLIAILRANTLRSHFSTTWYVGFWIPFMCYPNKRIIINKNSFLLPHIILNAFKDVYIWKKKKKKKIVLLEHLKT